MLPVSVTVTAMPAWIKVERYLPIFAGVAFLYNPLILEQGTLASRANSHIIFRVYNPAGGTN